MIVHFAQAFGRGKFESGDPILYWLDDVMCRGDEESLFDCRHSLNHNCGRRERAGVKCIGF